MTLEVFLMSFRTVISCVDLSFICIFITIHLYVSYCFRKLLGTNGAEEQPKNGSLMTVFVTSSLAGVSNTS